MSISVSRRTDWVYILGIVLIIGMVLFSTLGMSIIKVSNEQTYTVTVQSKEVKNGGDNGKYLVFTVDAETGESRVFEVTDSLLKGRFDSADVYNMIIPNHTYRFTTGGYRVPLFSMYQNIYEVVEVSSPDEKTPEPSMVIGETYDITDKDGNVVGSYVYEG